MNALRLPTLRRWFKFGAFIATGVVAVASGLAYVALAPKPGVAAQTTTWQAPAEASAEEVHRLCAACHAYPPPDSFPKFAWRKEVKQGYDFFHADAMYRFEYPPLESVVRYYQNRAPEELAALSRSSADQPPQTKFDIRNHRSPDALRPPGVAHIQLGPLFSKNQLDILVCDALNKQIVVYSPYASPPTWRVIARGLVCAHAEVVDLDGDGVSDVVLACLGNFYATDDLVGSVVWLKGAADGSFTPITLLDGVGRVADVRAADFTGDGKLDLVVAVFGWHKTGEILLLENRGTGGAKPTFVSRVLDTRHGTTHVPVADLNGDGKPDFVALISQEHETVVAFLNQGGGKFEKQTIFTAPHPAFGCCGLDLVDLDGDGDIDVLLANGDSLDAPYLLKPYHGVHWLENRGQFPFTQHTLANCNGAGSPIAADFNGDGRLDVAFVSFLPGEFFPQRAPMRLDSVVLLEQIAKGVFVRHQLEAEACDHLTCASGDLDGDGRPDLVIGNYVRGGATGNTISIWRNLSEKRPKEGGKKP